MTKIIPLILIFFLIGNISYALDDEIIKKYFEDGSLHIEEVVKNNETIFLKEYYENGKLYSEYAKGSEKEAGYNKIYFEDGSFFSTTSMVMVLEVIAVA